MSKKIIISTLLGTSLSFATWGYFPLKESDSGLQVKASHFIAFGDETPHSFNLNARYVFGSSLEISLMDLGYQISDPSGLQNPVAELRLQLGEKSLIFGEITLPIGDDSQEEYFHVGLQRAFALTSHFAWSSEIGFTNYFEDDAGLDKASKINVATEMDFNAKPSCILFVGAKADVNITKSENSGDDYYDDYYDYYYGYYYDDYYYDDENEDDQFDFGLTVFGGINLKIGKNTYLEEEFSMNLLGSDTYDYSQTAFKTSLKHSF